MARQSLPSFSNLWQKHEDLYVGIFITALGRLCRSNCDVSQEDRISEKLCPIFRDICFEQSRNNKIEVDEPEWDNPIQPVNDSELKDGKGKRPDFTCKRVNPFAVSADEHQISFHVECKLLGIPTSRNWILNKNYVTEGIKRFDSSSHEYGKRAPSGMMVGYIISMSPTTILAEVNSHQARHCSYNPAITFERDVGGIQRLGHNLKRENVQPERFKLIHLWVDFTNQSSERPTDEGS